MPRPRPLRPSGCRPPAWAAPRGRPHGSPSGRGAVGCVVDWRGPELSGILTARDGRGKGVARDVDYGRPVDEFMTPDPITLPLSATIGEAVNIMIERKFRHIPITEDGGERPLAVFSIKDVIDLLAQSFPTHVLNLPPRPHQEMSTREGA